jgi:hypothetical protein
MDNSAVDDALEAAEQAFQQPVDEPETGLDVDDGALLQLRKSCRLLNAVEALREQNGYYTLMIEAAFTAIERTLQFYLVEKGVLAEDEYPHNHETVYDLGAQAGLYSDDFGDRLLYLWNENRSKTYYRAGKASEPRAETMIALATQLHTHTINMTDKKHECRCSD